jgi:hypothetical protein
LDTKIPVPGEMVGAWALHAGDRIAVAEPGDGTIAAIVTEIRHQPGFGDELDWEAADHHCSGCLHYSPADLVNRLWANRKAIAA